MATQVLFRRGNTTQNDNFIGGSGELTVNLSNTAVRVHDGTTLGGVEMARADLTNVVGNVAAQPGGSNTNIQYNNANVLGGSNAFSFDNTTNTVSMTTLTTANVNGNLIPTANSTMSLGNTTNRWKDLYISGNTIYMDDAQIKSYLQTVVIKGLSITANGAVDVANAPAAGGMYVAANLAAGNVAVASNLSAGNATITANLVAGNANIANISGTTANYGNIIAGNITITGNVQVATIVNGNSNVFVSANSNVTISANSAANIVTVSGTANPINYTNSFTAAIGTNIIPLNSVAGLVVGDVLNAPTYLAPGTTVTAISGLNVTVSAALLITAPINTVFFKTAPTSLVTIADKLTTVGNALFNSNVTIDGNLTVGGNINIDFLVNGNSNVLVTANGNVSTSAAGNANILVVTGTGANVTGTLAVTGKSNLNAVGNVTITGGANSQFLRTDGTGNLTWATINNISNGTSNLVVNQDANVTISSNTIPNIAVFGTSLNQVNYTSTAIAALGATVVTLNTVAGLTAGKVLNAPTFLAPGTTVVSISGLNVTLSAVTILAAPIGTTFFTTAPVSFAELESTLAVAGDATFDSDVTVAGNLNVTGNINIDFLVNGNSNVLVSANGNVSTSVAGNANILVVTGTGANVTGTLAVTGKSNLNAVGNVTITGGTDKQFLQTDGAGNLVFATIDNITNGTSNLVVYEDANIAISSNTVANIAVFGTSLNQVNYTSTAIVALGNTVIPLNTVAGLTVGNILNAPTFLAPGTVITNITGLNVTIDLAAILAAPLGTVFFTTAPTSLATLTSNLSVAGDATFDSNVTIDGNLTVTGNININIDFLVNGNSNVLVSANGNVSTSVAGNANILVVTGTGVNIDGTLAVTGDATFDSNVTVDGNLTVTGNINIDYLVNGNSNVFVSENANVIVSSNGVSNILTVSAATNPTFYVSTAVASIGATTINLNSVSGLVIGRVLNAPGFLADGTIITNVVGLVVTVDTPLVAQAPIGTSFYTTVPTSLVNVKNSLQAEEFFGNAYTVALVANTTTGNIPTLDVAGNLTDSGKVFDDTTFTNDNYWSAGQTSNYVLTQLLNVPNLPPVNIATTANVTKSGLAAIDGVTPTANSYVLVKNQTNNDNGIWLAQSGAWLRQAVTSNVYTNVSTQTTYAQLSINNGIVNVLAGTANKNLQYQITITNPEATFGNTIVYVTTSTKLPIASPNNRFVDISSGNDTNNNGSSAFPFATITRSLVGASYPLTITVGAAGGTDSSAITWTSGIQNSLVQSQYGATDGGQTALTGVQTFATGSTRNDFKGTIHSTGASAPFVFQTGALMRNYFQDLSINTSAASWITLATNVSNWISLNNIVVNNFNPINLPAFTNPFTFYIYDQSAILPFTGTGAVNTNVVIVNSPDGSVRLPATYLGSITFTSEFSGRLGNTVFPEGIITNNTDLAAIIGWTADSTYDGYYYINFDSPSSFERGAIIGKQTAFGITQLWWARKAASAPAQMTTSTGKTFLKSVGNVTITGGTDKQFLQTDGAGNLTWATVDSFQIANGNSNVVVNANANVTISSNGVANVMSVSAATNPTNYLSTSITALGATVVALNTVAGLTVGQVLNATTFLTPGTTITNITGLNVTVSAATILAAPLGTTFFTTAPTSLVKFAGNISVDGTSNLGAVGNVVITGGSSSQVLVTNGSGSLSWESPAQTQPFIRFIANANASNQTFTSANIALYANANVINVVKDGVYLEANIDYVFSNATTIQVTSYVNTNSVIDVLAMPAGGASLNAATTSYNAVTTIGIGDIFMGSNTATAVTFGQTTTERPVVSSSAGVAGGSAPAGTYKFLGGSSTACLWTRTA